MRCNTDTFPDLQWDIVAGNGLLRYKLDITMEYMLDIWQNELALILIALVITGLGQIK